MKKILLYTKRSDGFVFPYVLFFIAVIFILFHTNLAMYQNERTLTENSIEQLRMETLFQMSQQETKTQFSRTRPSSTSGTQAFQYPDGNVTIHYKEKYETLYHALFKITTTKGSYHTFSQTIPVPPREKPSKKKKKPKDEAADLKQNDNQTETEQQNVNEIKPVSKPTPVKK